MGTRGYLLKLVSDKQAWDFPFFTWIPIFHNSNILLEIDIYLSNSSNI